MFDVSIACDKYNNTQEDFSDLLRCAGFVPHFININDIDPVSESCPQILFLSGQNLDQISQLLADRNLVFELLVAQSDQVMHSVSILERCATILVAPGDQEILAEILGEVLFPEVEADSSLSALSVNFVGRSAPVKDLISVVDQVARYDAPVLISGETGTGKELVARGIHYESKRCDFPFVPVNCGALTDELLISELFGHEHGAFTDAKRHHAGLVEQASQGTLFLDEVDSLSLKAQSSLLRFMQDQEYRPLGSERVLRSDVRIICATNRDLQKLVNASEFREDLFYRLKILDVHTPALKDRRTDIPLLIEHFLVGIARRYGEGKKRLHPLTERWMVDEYHWPGNVRELENYIHRVFVLSKGKTIYVPEMMGLPANIRVISNREPDAGGCQIGLFQEEKATYITRFERDYLSTLMEHAKGNVSEAARISGKERRALGKLLKKHGIDCQTYKKQFI